VWRHSSHLISPHLTSHHMSLIVTSLISFHLTSHHISISVTSLTSEQYRPTSTNSPFTFWLLDCLVVFCAESIIKHELIIIIAMGTNDGKQTRTIYCDDIAAEQHFATNSAWFEEPPPPYELHYNLCYEHQRACATHDVPVEVDGEHGLHQPPRGVPFGAIRDNSPHVTIINQPSNHISNRKLPVWCQYLCSCIVFWFCGFLFGSLAFIFTGIYSQ